MADRIVFDEAALQQLFASPDGPTGKMLAKRAVRVVAHAKKNMSAGGGRTYARGRTSHTASAPGQPPAVDTGRLRASIDSDLGADSRGLVARIGTNVVYARHLELGTVRMAARPFLRPALKAAK